jgi:hypothetical protein
MPVDPYEHPRLPLRVGTNSHPHYQASSDLGTAYYRGFSLTPCMWQHPALDSVDRCPNNVWANQFFVWLSFLDPFNGRSLPKCWVLQDQTLLQTNKNLPFVPTYNHATCLNKLIRYMICKYFLLFCRLSSLSWVTDVFNFARRQWLTPVILATWEAEICRIMVPGQPRQIVHETPPPSPK